MGCFLERSVMAACGCLAFLCSLSPAEREGDNGSGQFCRPCLARVARPDSLAAKATGPYLVGMQERVKPKTRATKSPAGKRMVRKRVLLSADQNRRLKALAAASGKSEAALIRGGIERVLAEQFANPDDWKRRFLDAVANLGDMSELADRVEANKKEQAKLWRKRMARNEKQMRGD